MLTLLLTCIVLTQTPSDDLGFVPRADSSAIPGDILEQELPRGTVVKTPTGKPFTVLAPVVLLNRTTVEMALGWRDQRDSCLAALGKAEQAECESLGGSTSLLDAMPWIIGIGVSVVAIGFTAGAIASYELTKPR